MWKNKGEDCYDYYNKKTSNEIELKFAHLFQPKPINVQVITHHMQRYAVWFGGSMLASTVNMLVFMLCPVLPVLACFSPNFTKCAIPKRHMKSMAPAYAGTIPYLVQ